MKVLEVIGHDGDRYFAGPQVEDAWDEARNPRSRTTIVYLSPAEFINLAEVGFDDVKAQRVQSILDSGKPFSSLPMLGFDEAGKVIGHEGRHRARALASLGVHQIPVLLRSSITRWGEDLSKLPTQLLPQSRSGKTIPMPQSVIFPQKTLREFVEPNEALRGGVFYHGTTRTEVARKILKHGIQPGNVGPARSQMATVGGAAYLTPSLRYAIIYAIGGDMLGTDASYLINKSGSPYCYVFVISGDKLNRVQPDEDSVGEAVHHAYDIIQNNAQWANNWKDTPLYVNLAKPENKYFTAEVLRLAKYAMTDRQFRETLQGYLAYQAAGGKRFLKVMSPHMKQKLIQMGAHIAHLGPIQPDQCWRFDRRLNPKLAKDGSNFFELAKRIA